MSLRSLDDIPQQYWVSPAKCEPKMMNCVTNTDIVTQRLSWTPQSHHWYIDTFALCVTCSKLRDCHGLHKVIIDTFAVCVMCFDVYQNKCQRLQLLIQTFCSELLIRFMRRWIILSANMGHISVLSNRWTYMVWQFLYFRGFQNVFIDNNKHTWAVCQATGMAAFQSFLVCC